MDAFAALGDPTRRQIIEMLASSGRMSATDIARRFQISAPAVSQHLKVLREAGLVTMEKRAQQRLYTLNPQAMAGVELWAQQMAQRWEARYRLLDDVLEVEKQKLAQKGNPHHE